jgi:hypothetical protein
LISPREREPVLECTGFFALQLGSPLIHIPGLMDPPADVVLAYNTCLPQAASLTVESLSFEWSEKQHMELMMALAAFRGQPRLAGLLLRTQDWISCRNCEHEFDPLQEWGGSF